MEVILVRHGQTKENKDKVFHGWIDSSLDDIGLEQANSIAAHLSGEQIDAILTSPLKRTVDTARIIASKKNDCEIFQEDGIKEINFGLFEGLTYSEISSMYRDEASKWEQESLKYRFPQGESIPDFFNRIKAFWDNMIQKDYKKVVLVTHEGCIRCILSYITNNCVDLFWKYSVKTGSISRIAFDDGFSYILSINENYKKISF